MPDELFGFFMGVAFMILVWGVTSLLKSWFNTGCASTGGGFPD